jgi:hypothetical protein
MLTALLRYGIFATWLEEEEEEETEEEVGACLRRWAHAGHRSIRVRQQCTQRKQR